MTDPMPITPQTRVGELLDAYPDLEAVLIAQAPAFKRLKNPLLRRTVAKLATLETAAGMAGLEVRDLVLTLRRAAGQPEGEVESAQTVDGVAPEPDWLRDGAVTQTLDADKLLTAGQMPLAVVQRAARELKAGQVLQMTVSFVPTPMIDALRQARFLTHLGPRDGGFVLSVAPGGSTGDGSRTA